MLNDLDRNILKCILDERTTNGKTLSARCNASINTIRKEISIINDEISAHGLCVEANAYKGYSLIVVDETRALPFIASFQRASNLHSFMSLSAHEKVYFLVRKFLSASAYLSVNSICDELFCSKSTVLRDIKKANEYLEQFNLQLTTHRNRGIILTGSECDRRMCLISQYRLFLLLSPESRERERRFSGLFMENSSFHTVLRRILVNTINQYSEYSIPNFLLNNIVHMVILNKTRKTYSTAIELTEEQSAAIDGTLEREVAAAFYEQVPEYFKTDVSESDVAMIAAMLASYRSYAGSEPSRKRYAAIYDDAAELIATYRERFSCFLNIDSMFERDTFAYMCGIYFRLLFHVPLESEMTAKIKFYSNLSIDMCIDFALFYRNKYGVMLHSDNILGYFYVCRRITRQTSKKFSHARILLNAEFGIYTANCLAKRIKRNYAEYIETIDTAEFTNSENIDCTKYDAVLSDIQPAQYMSLGIPVITYYGLPVSGHIPQLDQFFLDVSRNSLSEIFSPESIIRGSFKDKTGCFRFLAKHLSDGGDEQQLYDDFVLRDSFISSKRSNNIAVVSRTAGHGGGTPRILVLLSSHHIEWDDTGVYFVLFYCYGSRAEDMHVVKNGLFNLTHLNPERMKDLVEKPGYNQFVDALLRRPPDESGMVPVEYQQ